MSAPEAIRTAVLGVDGVHGMHRGPHGTASTYSPTGRVWGVRMSEQQVDVHLIAFHGLDLRVLGTSVERAVLGALPDYAGAVRVHVEDLVVRPQQTGPDPSGRTP